MTHASRTRRVPMLALWAFAALASIAIAYALARRSTPSLDQSTPEATIATARHLVESARAEHLAALIYADDPDMRLFVDRMGVLFAHLQRLATTIQATFPAETSKLREEAQSLAASGKSASALGAIVQSAMRQSGQRQFNPKQQGEQRRAFEAALQQLFADPYALLNDSGERLTTEPVDDTLVSLRWDGKPLLPPIGMQMKLADGRWYFVLPIKLPFLVQYLPRTKDEWAIWGSLVAVFDKVIVDLRKDVEAGRVKSLADVSRAAGEKAFLPAVMVVVAYGRALELRKQAGAADIPPSRPATMPPPPADHKADSGPR